MCLTAYLDITANYGYRTGTKVYCGLLHMRSAITTRPEHQLQQEETGAYGDLVAEPFADFNQGSIPLSTRATNKREFEIITTNTLRKCSASLLPRYVEFYCVLIVS